MPDQPPAKRRERMNALHRGGNSRSPVGMDREGVTRASSQCASPRYAELHCKTNFSFLEGASHPDELVARAAELGYAALAITDRNSLAGVVQAHAAAKEIGMRLIVGAEVTPIDAPPVVLLATDRTSYGRLARLITTGRRRAPKGECHITFDDLVAHADGLIAGLLSPDRVAPAQLARYHDAFGDRCYLLAELHRGPDDMRRLSCLVEASRRSCVQLVAANDVHYHIPSRRVLQDVLTAIRYGTTVAKATDRLFPNGERYLKAGEEMASLIAADGAMGEFWRDAMRRTIELADRCRFSLDELRYEYPEELSPPGVTPLEYLTRLTWAGARAQYPAGVPDKVRRLVEHELQLIEELHYEAYFLTVWDLVRFARSRGILCQGRGSAANSAVCYCLGVTAVDPERIDVLFERFISRERAEAPDIDVDFEHERREEVLQYIYDKYGRERAGMTAEVITYRVRSAMRDVGKALGLSLDRVDALAKNLEGYGAGEDLEERCREIGLDPAALVQQPADPTPSPRASGERVGVRGSSGATPVATPPSPRPSPPADGGRGRSVDTHAPSGPSGGGGNFNVVRQWLALARHLIGFPRHLSQHVGGMVITRGPLCELVPIENAAMPGRTVIEWDKDDLDALGILKVDCLALGMLTAIHKCFDLIERHGGTKLTLAEVPPEDPTVYAMIGRSDTVGVFQIESRAQMSMLPRLRPRCFYDLVIEVAIVRPGPIQGQMVHPYLRRRAGLEAIEYPSEAVRAVLEKTLGVPLFQEQAMRLAVVAAGFTPGEADKLRRAMGAWRRPGLIEQFQQKFLAGMRANGYSAEFTERLFRQILGFGEYGFPESHAASFALLAYVSAWLKCHFPAAFTAALVNSQPMGFYAPAQLIRDARQHGVAVRPVDVNSSAWDCTLERRPPHGSPDERMHIERLPSDRRQHAKRDGDVLRLGLRMIRGLAQAHAERIVAARGDRSFQSLDDFTRRTGLGQATLVRLTRAAAFGSLRVNRRTALWQALGQPEDLPLFRDVTTDEPPVALAPLSLAAEVLADYRTEGLSLRAHPVALVRSALDAKRVVPAAWLAHLPSGRHVRVAGLVLVRQRPGTASGITFVTLEDESGVANLVVHKRVWDRHHRAACRAQLLFAEGRLERQGDVIHVITTRLEDQSSLLAGLATSSRDFH